MLGLKGKSWTYLVAVQDQWNSMESKFFLTRDMRINCSLLDVLKNAAGSFAGTDNTRVHAQSAIQICIWNLVANELIQNAAKSLLTNES